MRLEQENEENTESYFNFIQSLRTPATKSAYKLGLMHFVRYCHLEKISQLMSLTPEELRDQIVKYFLETNGQLARSTQIIRISAIKHFCEMNDIILNWKKINKFVHSDVPKAQDRAYTHDEIKTAIEYSDYRIKSAYLILASTGIRAGVLRQIKMKHLEDKGTLYKLTVYSGVPEEYFTFTTPECKEVIDRYLSSRKRNGEALTSESYLYIKQYNPLRRIRPRPFSERSFEGILHKWLVNCGVIQVDPTNNQRKRKQVQRLHGFRKFFTTQLVHAKVIPEIREMLLGHKIGLASSYYKPTEQDMLDDYMKAVDNLTINPENRLKRKVEKLEVERSQFDKLAAKIARLEKKIK